MLFTTSAHAGLLDGSITVTFRTWKRPQARVGGVYRSGPVELTVDRMDRVPIGRISARDARRAGFGNLDALVRFLRLDESKPSTLVWRIEFHCRPAPPRTRASGTLSAAEIDELTTRLVRLDLASPTGPWAHAVLALIADRPGVVSTDLAAQLGRERAAFKKDVRKLKALGLTESLEVGYRLSPRGETLLRELGRR